MPRAWARGVTTTYTTNAAGDLASIGYSDSTPGVAYTYDREGRLSTAVCNGTTTTRSYDIANDVLSESSSGGILNGLAVDYTYDSLLRRTNMAVLNGATVLSHTTNSYDGAGRISVVGDGTNTATYTYLANSPMVDHIVFANSGTGVMTTRYTNDYVNRLTGISSVLNYAYGYNTASQRTSITNGDGTIWDYQYDSLGQVTNGVKHWGNGNVVAGQQFGYGFDNIGNRTMTLAGGDKSDNNRRRASYAANNLNQYTSRTVPGDVDVIGNVNSSATVWVDQIAAYQTNSYFWQAAPVANSSSPQFQTVTTLAALPNGSSPEYGVTNIGHVFVPETPESYSYDYDGNLTQDGRWSYTWDGENRLLGMTSLSGAPTASLFSLSFAYDYQGRRIQKQVSTNSGSGYVAQYTNDFVYDGWNLEATLNPGSLINSFVWGLDLSQSLQGAGGVGGLVMENIVSNGVQFPAYDGNGNVTALANTSGTVTATYEYGPFGELIRATGPVASLNPFLFSTKYRDAESGFYYYGLRYYDPSSGRWPSRDPIGELGFQTLTKPRSRRCLFDSNPYGFVLNNPLGGFDPDGRITVRTKSSQPSVDGSYNVEWNFILDHSACQDGYFVQQVTFSYAQETSLGGKIQSNARIYWEAWPVSAGHQWDDNHFNPPFWDYTDNANRPDQPGTMGVASQSGTIKFFFAAHTKNMAGFAKGAVQPTSDLPGAGDLLSTEQPPLWFGDASDNGEADGFRYVTVNWSFTASAVVVIP